MEHEELFNQILELACYGCQYQGDAETPCTRSGKQCLAKKFSIIHHLTFIKEAKEEKPKTPDFKKAQALRDAGWTLDDIAIEIGCSLTTVSMHTQPGEERGKTRQNEGFYQDFPAH